MANDAHEEFWGCTLSGNKKEYLWDPEADNEEDVEHKLQLNTACLGHKAKDGQRHIVEVTTQDDDGKKVTCPIVSLRVGGTECIHIDLGFHNTTKFVLKEGAGPLSLCGVHLKALPLDFDENDDSSEDEDIPDLVCKPNAECCEKPVKPVEQKSNKRTLSETKEDLPSKKKKKADPKPVEESEDDEDDIEENDEEEEDSEEEEMPSLLDGEAEEADSDEESEDEDEELEGDDVDSEEDDDDDEDDEEEDEESDDEEEEVKPKKKQMNGQAAKQTPGKDKKKSKEDPKTPGNKTPAGKKESVQTPKSQAKKTPAELKAFLLKSPNLPKKFDKFANFMKNNMKVTDEKSQKDLWDYVQKNKK